MTHPFAAIVGERAASPKSWPADSRHIHYLVSFADLDPVIPTPWPNRPRTDREAEHRSAMRAQVLRMLEEATPYVSGASMAIKLRCTEATVRAHIGQLAAEGYRIGVAFGIGYMLAPEYRVQRHP